jgi:Mrp family chromosome partitioning ATPase
VVVIRTTLEATLPAPFSVAVTSVAPGDGKTALAVGLAQAFADAGYRTALIDANPEDPAVGRTLGIGTLPAARTLETVASLRMTAAAPNLDAGSIADTGLMMATSSSALRSFAGELRGLYAVTVWDTGTVFGDSLAIQCATACDGVLVAVRYGRRVVPDDSRIVGTLEQVGANVIGIVPTGIAKDGNRGRVRLPSAAPEAVAPSPAVGQQFWKAGKP